MNIRFAICILCLLLPRLMLAQTDTARSDEKIYSDIEKAARNGKASNFLYRLFFKPVNISSSQKKRHQKVKGVQRSFGSYEGKIIRDISIFTMDPFGRSVTDTTHRPDGFWSSVGNGTHVKSHRITILNLLLFGKGEPFDSLLVLESERLVRSQEYIHEVLFYAQSVPGSDSVDVFIRVLDNWSLVPRLSGSTSGFKADVAEKNFLGLGHKFQNIFTRDFTEGNDFATSYIVPNIRNTYIQTSFAYSHDRFGNTFRGMSVDRPFFSAVARWAGGAALSTQYKNDSLATASQEYETIHYRFRTFDTWVGHAHRLFKGPGERARITRMTYTARYVQTRYLDRPAVPDSLPLFVNQNLYLVGIGISSPKYLPEKYVFRYGVTEDIPIGKIFSLTAGYQERLSSGRMYFGFRCGYGNFANMGYLSAQLEYGTFFRSGRAEEGVLKAGFIFFSNLADVGSWKFRQFFKPHLTLGLNRLPVEQIQFDRENGMGGFSSPTLLGDKRFVLTLQTQSYAPWKVLGFQFGPYFIYSIGMLGDPGAGFERSRVYHQVSLGVLLQNDYLVFKNIQFSISYYPDIPGIGEHVFKSNARTTTDFMLRDFNMNKPYVVPFE